MKHTSHTQKTSTDINFPPSFFLSLSISSYFSFFFFLVFDSVFRPKTIVCNVYILHIMDDCDGEVNTNSSGLMPYFFLLSFFSLPSSKQCFHHFSWLLVGWMPLLYYYSAFYCYSSAATTSCTAKFSKVYPTIQ